MSSSYLSELSAELLLKIFGYLELTDLCHLRQTCRRFNDFITSWVHVILKGIKPLVTNQESENFRARCMRPLSTFEQIRISKNWKIGRYKEYSLLFAKKKYMPWLYLNNRFIWLSRGRNIYCYERNRNNINVGRPYYIVYGRSNADIGNFQLKDDFLLSGQRDGSIWLKNIRSRRFIFDQQFCHDSDINSVDITKNGSTVISGCRNNCLCIWRVNSDPSGNVVDSRNILERTYCSRLIDRVWKVSLLDGTPLLAVGTSGNLHSKALLILDIEHQQQRFLPSSNRSRDTEDYGILDIKWDGPNTLWSCGYDTYLRRWDLRTGSCVQIFADPHASALYCIDYNYCNTIMTGTQMHGRVILWDIRQRNNIQLFFMESCKSGSSGRQRSSPIYSLSFDSEFLFTATDQNLNVLNFSVYNGTVRDYSDCCRCNNFC